MAHEDDLKAVGSAYRVERLKAPHDHPAHSAAKEAYRRLHPAASAEEVATATARLIAEAAERWGGWIYGSPGATGPD